MNQSMRVAEVLEAALYVTDLTAAEQFYTKVLGLTFFSKQEGRHVFFRCGQRMVLLFNAEATSVSAGGSTEIPVHGAKGAGHLAFAARDVEIDRWKDHLAKHGVRIEREVNWGVDPYTSGPFAQQPGRFAFAVGDPRRDGFWLWDANSREKWQDEIDRWKDHLAKHGVEIEREIHWERSRAIYFRDAFAEQRWKSPRHCCGGSPKRQRFPPASNQEAWPGKRSRNISVDLDRVPVWGQ